MMPLPGESGFLEFVYTPVFERTRKGVFTDDEIKALENTLLANPHDGVVMANTGGVRKSRTANEGRGKRGSGRVAYLYVETQQTIYFLLAFPKNVQANLAAGQKKAVRGLVADIEREVWPRQRQSQREESIMARHEDRIEVTEENFASLLIDGLGEALAIARGEEEPALRARRPVTARASHVHPPRAYGADSIQGIRKRMGLSQKVFASVLNASSDTVKAWEQGKRQPDGMALALLEVAERHPAVLLERVHDNPAKRARVAAAQKRSETRRRSARATPIK